jgi:putative spermidine/putrescine transport system permease protein
VTTSTTYGGRRRATPATLALRVYVLVVLVFLIFPTLVVIPMSFSDSSSLEFPPSAWSLRWYRAYFSSSEWMAATLVSARVALLTTLFATILGTAAAYGLHFSRARWAAWARAVLAVPLIMPVILIGIGVFFLYTRLGLVNTTLGLALAHGALAMPFVVVTVSAGLQVFDVSQEMVARSLGASRARAFFTITLPQISFSVLCGSLFALITSLDEVIIAMFVSGGEKATLTRRMFNSLRDAIDPTIAAISTCLILVAICAAVLVQHLQRSRSRTAPQD